MQTILRASFIEMRINFRNLLTLKLILALSLTAIAEGQPRAKSQPQSFDIIIRGGTVYDGTGRPPVRTDVGIKGDRIAARFETIGSIFQFQFLIYHLDGLIVRTGSSEYHKLRFNRLE